MDTISSVKKENAVFISRNDEEIKSFMKLWLYIMHAKKIIEYANCKNKRVC